MLFWLFSSFISVLSSCSYKFEGTYPYTSGKYAVPSSVELTMLCPSSLMTLTNCLLPFLPTYQQLIASNVEETRLHLNCSLTYPGVETQAFMSRIPTVGRGTFLFFFLWCSRNWTDNWTLYEQRWWISLFTHMDNANFVLPLTIWWPVCVC